MSGKHRGWLAAQIAGCDLASLGLMGHVRLAEAAAALTGRGGLSQAFGLQLPAAPLEDAGGDERVDDPRLLSQLDGRGPSSDLSLVELPCIQAVVDAGEEAPWALDGWATLGCHGEGARLRCQLSFDLVRAPTEEELGRLLRVIREELLFSGWGMNLDWDLEGLDPRDFDGRHPQVEPVILGHRFEPLPAD